MMFSFIWHLCDKVKTISAFYTDTANLVDIF